MNKIDEFYFFLIKAITRPDKSQNNYYYNKRTEILFGLRLIEGGWYPLYRNQQIEEDQELRELFLIQINLVKRHNPDIISLFSLSQKEKKHYLTSYLQKAKNSTNGVNKT